MEKIILGSIERHLKNNAIRHSQPGFIKGKSCLTNLISFYDKVTRLVDEGKVVDAVFLDFSKAFRYTPSEHPFGQNVRLWDERVHSVLGEELAEEQGSKGGSEWDYLWLVTGHQQYSSGFGSRATFLQYINKLDAGVESTISKSANDTKLGGAVVSHEGQEALQRDPDKWDHWAMTDGMKFNKSKCQILHFGWSDARHKYRLGEE